MTMKTVKTSEGRWRCFLGRDEYELVLARVQQKFGDDESWILLAIRLLALSVRVGTLDRIKRKDFREGERGLMLLRVREKNTQDDDDERRPRDIWIPRPLYNDLKQYMDANNIGPDDHLFRRSESTFRRRLNSVAEDLAEETGDDQWLKLTPHDFRRYYAVHFLFRLRIDPAVVRQMGGWLSEEAMMEYLILPDDVLADELESCGALGTYADTYHEAAGDVEALLQTFKTLISRMETAPTRADALRRVEECLNAIEGVEAEISIDIDRLEELEDPSTPQQRRLTMFGGISPEMAATLFAHEVKATTAEEWSRNKMAAMKAHPEYIDPTTRIAKARLAFGAVAIVSTALFFSFLSPFSSVGMGATYAVGTAIGLYQMNQDLKEAPAQPV